MYDPVIGRWISVDPARQFASPYLGMGNNPLQLIDSDGRNASPIYTSEGDFLGVDSEGFEGDIIIMDEADYKGFTFNGEKTLDHNFVMELAEEGVFANYISSANLGLSSMAKVFNHVLSQLPEMDMSLLLKSIISLYDRMGGIKYNDGAAISNEFSTSYINGVGNYPVKLTIGMTNRRLNQGYKTTVENLQNAVGIHEFLGHAIMLYGKGNGPHYKAYELQFAHPTWKKVGDSFKQDMLENYNYLLLSSD
jgi:uncharacterized protein RhaS with RHS repeats